MTPTSRTSTLPRRAAVTALAAAAVAVGALALAPEALAATKLSQSAAASQLSAAGVTHSSSGGCTTRSNSTCTSYDQINQSTVDGVVTLKRASGCAINITGGTEVGHASGTYSHYNGYKVDIQKNSCINSYVTNSFTKIGDRGDGYPQWQSAAGNIYCDEGTHWDVLYK